MGKTKDLGHLAYIIAYDANGNVGINGNPSSYSNFVYFDIIGNSTNQGGIIQSRNSDNSVITSLFTNLNGGNLRTETNHPLLFSPYGTERMRILANGNVGIGTSSPTPHNGTNALIVKGGSGSRGIMEIWDGASGKGLFQQVGGDTYIGNLDKASTGGNLFLLVNGTGTTADTGMKITSSGNVGIGSENVTNGTTFGGGGQVNRLKISSSNYPCFEINTTSDGGGSIQFTTGVNLPNQVKGFIGYNSGGGTVNELVISNIANGPMVFATNNTERMRITSSGNIGIATTPSTTTNATLVIARDGTYSNDVNPASLILCGITNTNRRMSLGYDTSGNYSYIVSGEYGVQWTQLYLQKTGGGVYAGSARIDNNSDIRVKDNISQLTGALGKVLSMNGKRFHMIDEPESKIRYGFIAQELQGVVDELVIESDRTYIKEDGTKIENLLGLETWGSSWAALLVEAIKEQQVQIESQQARIAYLENK